jgi:hypothetical protein
MSFLKTSTLQLGDETLELTELAALGQLAVMEAQEAQGISQYDGIFNACRYGVVGWSAKSLDEVKATVTLAQANTIATAVFALSGVAQKN